jgi:chromosome segregation ATPase
MTLEKKKKQMEEISKKIKSLYELRSTNKREKTSLLVSIRSMKDQVINTEKEIRHQEKMLLNCQISHQKIEDNITQIVGRIHYYRVSISIGNISSESQELLSLEDDLKHLEEEFEIASTNYNAFESTEEALKKKLVEIKENIVSSKKRFQELVEEGVSLEEQIKTMNRSINADILTEYEILKYKRIE